MRKYILRKDLKKKIKGKTLYRVHTLIGKGNFHVDEFGGFIEGYKNLSQKGFSWVYPSAIVYGNVQVKGNLCVYDGVYSDKLKTACITYTPREEDESNEWKRWRKNSYLTEKELLKKYPEAQIL